MEFWCAIIHKRVDFSQWAVAKGACLYPRLGTMLRSRGGNSVRYRLAGRHRCLVLPRATAAKQAYFSTSQASPR